MIDNYTEAELAFIIEKKESTDLTWAEITEKYNKKFRKDKNFESIKKAYQRNKNYFATDDNHIRTLKAIHRTKRSNSYTAKENRTILDHWNKRDDFLEAIENTVKKMAIKKYKVPAYYKKSKAKKNMTLELLFSDVHYGKYIDDIEGNYVDINVIRERVRRIAESVVKEIHRESKSFNVEKVVIAMIGDIVENADFHGKESTKACEFSTARQIQEAIESIYQDLILPIAMTGIKIHIPCVTGNHDRISKDKTYVKPGEDNLTYAIYKSVALLCRTSGLKNVTFDIVSRLYTDVEIYGNIVIYEHGDELKNMNRDTMATMMNKRQAQLGKVAHFYRVGHFHEPVVYGQGRMMVNGSVPGQDSYAESKGFWSEALQIMNYYVETKKRNTCFFRSFPIYLQKK